MNISKHGNRYSNQGMEQFLCGFCGCEFDVYDDEYYVDLCGADIINTNPLTTGNCMCHDYIVCSCPECHKIIKKTRDRMNIVQT